MSLLIESLIYLLAAIISVSISRRLGFGSVLGYLVAGIVIGPFGLKLISDPEHILHFAEFGVVLLLFIVGLELQPSRLWVLRRMVFGLGAAQVFVSALLIGIIGWAVGLPVTTATIVGFILALSSTAFVLQMLAEKKQLTSTHGRAAFSILLFQDLAVIPLIAIMPILGNSAADSQFDVGSALFSIGILGALIVGGRYLLRPILHIAALARIPEIFTATSLLVVIASALLMEFAGMSMVLGAFIAGMLLADSEYRHELEGDIAPFKGLFLGLFFIAVGMSVNLDLLFDNPIHVLTIVAGLMLAKAVVILPLARLFGMCDLKSAVRLAALMSQGGEFAFVLFALATREGIIAVELSETLILAVTVSLLMTPFLYMLAEGLTQKFETQVEPDYDDISASEHSEILIAGFGRVGQIVGRLLRIVGKPFTALEADPGQVRLIRRYGAEVHYGDAARLDLLRSAGAEHARIIVIATSNMETSLHIAKNVVRHFPNLTIVARARNRRHAHKLMDLGIKHICRDTLLSSVEMSKSVLGQLGMSAEDVDDVAEMFIKRDEQLLAEQHAIHDSEEKLIQTAKDTVTELETLFKSDRRIRKNTADS
jgi:glutathione-regulated potassium-efflux system ancillary protein KefC/glutathione-regulated potassium-efflux system protein KefB